ncbi:hypothetical protein SAICODRAFT_7322 [Saitoella complicata NRRL Y-17804]|nr:uncharacterized protein SAICODRAFT_7322 [Saitoella complicata NRRL Y-17804]ODQ53165.1 hypothetical protein SAICODRAFT_7322 [Saitoella complicata NRRL Y-17804]
MPANVHNTPPTTAATLETLATAASASPSSEVSVPGQRLIKQNLGTVATWLSPPMSPPRVPNFQNAQEAAYSPVEERDPTVISSPPANAAHAETPLFLEPNGDPFETSPLPVFQPIRAKRPAESAIRSTLSNDPEFQANKRQHLNSQHYHVYRTNFDHVARDPVGTYTRERIILDAYFGPRGSAQARHNAAAANAAYSAKYTPGRVQANAPFNTAAYVAPPEPAPRPRTTQPKPKPKPKKAKKAKANGDGPTHKPRQPRRKEKEEGDPLDTHEMNLTDLLDYTPDPFTTLDGPQPKGMRTDWKGPNIDLTGDPYAHLLHPSEIALAATLRLRCATYLDCKVRMFFEFRKCKTELNKEFRKTDAQKALKVDVNKASKLWDCYNKVGWFDEHWLQVGPRTENPLTHIFEKEKEAAAAEAGAEADAEGDATEDAEEEE